MASKLILLLIVTAALGVSFWCLADPGSMPAGASAPDPNLPAGPEFALLAEPLRLGPTAMVPTGFPLFSGDSSWSAGGISRPPLYPSRR